MEAGWHFLLPSRLLDLSLLLLVTLLLSWDVPWASRCGLLNSNLVSLFQDSVVAITFVALGTSLPDTFASRTAAIASPTAGQ